MDVMESLEILWELNTPVVLGCWHALLPVYIASTDEPLEYIEKSC